MKTLAALAGGFLLLATAGDSFAQVSGSGSINVTGGANPSVTSSGSISSSTATSSTTSSSSSDPTITSSGNTGSSVLNNRTSNRSVSQGGQGGRGGQATARTASRASGGSGGYAGAVGNQVQVVTGGGYTGTTGGGGTAGDPYVGVNTTNYTGGYTQTLRNVPEVIAPSVNGGANGCAVGLSGGVSVAGFGISTGAGWSDPDCERRNLAALAYNMNEHDLAQEILCDSKEVRAARMRMGKPCIADRPPGITVGAAEVQRVDPAILQRQQDTLQSQQPRPTAPVVPVTGPAGGTITTAAVVQKPQRPDWCDTSSPQELRAHRECD